MSCIAPPLAPPGPLAAMNAYALLDALNTPVWIILPATDEILFANRQALAMASRQTVADLRGGCLSARAQERLADYTPSMLQHEQVVEIWTVRGQDEAQALGCHLGDFLLEDGRNAILVEGMLAAIAPPHSLPAAAGREGSFHEMLMQTNSAPMLLIDPADEGRIVNVNQAAIRFYGYSRTEFTEKHTWEINAMGRAILPVMQHIAQLPGGHKPLSFVHRLADGSLRDVQTYAGPVVIHGKRLMLCVIHDITEQKRLKSELEQAALKDPLTGLWNRRHLLLQLERSIQEKQRFGNDFSLILLDADNFKHINDRYGHFTGDEVLVWLAKTLESRVRAVDSVCRWGGEEFVILLPQTSRDNALLLAESLRQTVAQTRHDKLPAITVSIGVAIHQEQETVESLIMRVDSALYQAKNQGRNCVIAA
ncbi:MULTISPECIES: diguanylate cyclase [Aquitalea]|uniref:GGDEF domain-containing protein n=1 Tax=Aquitalea TaxID=407217 RepID=UPI001F0D42C5|nr:MULTISPECIES: diguanylate cyclase [Aquitalea]